MTAEQAKALGYEVKAASAFEVGVVKNGVGLKTWWSQDFDRKLPTLDHPKILEYIEQHECFEKEWKSIRDYRHPLPVCCERCHKLTHDAGVLESPHNMAIHDTSCDPAPDRYWICVECFPVVLDLIRFHAGQPPTLTQPWQPCGEATLGEPCDPTA